MGHLVKTKLNKSVGIPKMGYLGNSILPKDGTSM